MKRSLYLFMILLGSTPCTAKVILWDLGGVLFEPSKFGVAQAVGLSYFARHALTDFRSPNIQATLFDVLSLLEKPLLENTRVAGSAHGIELPTIMCRWQAGTITGAEIIKRANTLIDKLYKADYFDSKDQMVLIKRCIAIMFNPEHLAANIYAVEEGIQLLHESSLLRNEDGTKTHRHFVFSNWDHISFDTFKKRNRRVFSYFEAIVISGHIKRIKPHRDAFEYLIETFNLNPKECILIDDQEINAQAARKCGMEAILIRERDYQTLRADLKKRGIL